MAQAQQKSEQTKVMQFELVSPERKIASRSIVKASIPTSEGIITIGPGHTAIVMEAYPGVVSYFTDEPDAKEQQAFISGGFVDISPSACSILADRATTMEDMPFDNIKEELEEAMEKFNAMTTLAERLKFEPTVREIIIRYYASKGKNIFIHTAGDDDF